jgi:NAD(P)-dependent dehydrogenase (short-subunit alcohol dehydrogenase family)
MKIANRTFIISGGSSGLGLATVADLLTSDAYVSIVDLKPPQDPGLSSSRVKFFQTDISKVEDIEKAVEGVVVWTKETGALLGGVINCAGIGTAGKVRSLFISTANNKFNTER